MQLSLPLLPADHVRALHPIGRRGIATVAQRVNGWTERPVCLTDLPSYVALLEGLPDVYVSQQSFYGFRRIAQLAQLGAAYSDLDYHNVPRWAGRSPEQMVPVVLATLADVGVPAPSYILATGRGLLVTWLHDLVPRAALPRWTAMQRRLLEVLRPLGADPRAIDAARVFRLAGTKHSRNKAVVRLVWPAATAASMVRWSFDDLARELLSRERAEIVALRARRAERQARGQGRKPNLLRTVATYWETVLADLQRLREYRWFGNLPPGHRDAWLFLACVAISWLAPPFALRREILSLAKQAGGWDERETNSRLSSAISRAEQAVRGEKFTFQGKAVDPRYRFRAATIIEWLNITQAEMRCAGLRVLIDGTIGRERALERQHARRRRAGVQARTSYEAQSQHRRERALALRAHGLTFRAIATELGISLGEAHRLAHSDVQGVSRCMGWRSPA